MACSLDTALWGLLLTLINLCWVTGLQQSISVSTGETVLLVRISLEGETSEAGCGHGGGLQPALPSPQGGENHCSKKQNPPYSQVSRTQFQKLLEGTKERRLVGAKEFVIEEKVSRVNSLSLVLSGRLLVSQVGILIIIIIIIIFIFIIFVVIVIIANACLAGGQASPRCLGEPVS